MERESQSQVRKSATEADELRSQLSRMKENNRSMQSRHELILEALESEKEAHRWVQETNTLLRDECGTLKDRLYRKEGNGENGSVGESNGVSRAERDRDIVTMKRQLQAAEGKVMGLEKLLEEKERTMEELKEKNRWLKTNFEKMQEQLSEEQGRIAEKLNDLSGQDEWQEALRKERARAESAERELTEQRIAARKAMEKVSEYRALWEEDSSRAEIRAAVIAQQDEKLATIQDSFGELSDRVKKHMTHEP